MKIPRIDTDKQVTTTEGVTTMMIRYGWPLFLAMLASVLATPAGHRTIRRQNWPSSCRTRLPI